MFNTKFKFNLIIFIITLLSLFSNYILAETAGGGRSNKSESSTSQKQNAEHEGIHLTQSKCPVALKKWIIDDYSDKMFGLKSESKSCNNYIKNYQKNTKLSAHSNQNISLNLSKETASKNQSLNQQMSHELSSKLNPQLKNFISGCNDLSPTQSQQVLSRFYSSSLKIENANQQALDEIAYLDSLDQHSLSLTDVECNNVFPELRKKCSNYRKLGEQCKHKNKDRFDHLAKKTRSNIETVKKLNKAYKECKDKVKPVSKCEKIQVAITLIQNETPWMNQTEFKKILAGKQLKPNEQVSQDVVNFAMKHQFESTRKHLSDFVKKNNQMMRCMMYTTDDKGEKCDFKEMRTDLSKYPNVELPFKPKSANQRELAAYIETDLCLQERGEDREQTLSTLKSSATDAALTVLSAGAIGVVAGVKALSTANRVSKVKHAVGSSALAVDTSRSALGIHDAFNDCSNAYPDIALKEKPEETQKQNICGDNTASQSYQNIENKNNCVIEALLSSSEFLPLIGSLPGFARLSHKYTPEELAEMFKDPKMRKQVEEILARNGQLNDTERMKAADTLLNRKLSPEVQKCMLSAHNIASQKSFGEYNQSELLAKKTALNKCVNADGSKAFSATDITLLMRSGITGNSNSIAKQLKTGNSEEILEIARKNNDPNYSKFELYDRASQKALTESDPQKAIDLLKEAGENQFETYQHFKKLSESSDPTISLNAKKALELMQPDLKRKATAEISDIHRKALKAKSLNESISENNKAALKSLDLAKQLNLDSTVNEYTLTAYNAFIRAGDTKKAAELAKKIGLSSDEQIKKLNSFTESSSRSFNYEEQAEYFRKNIDTLKAELKKENDRNKTKSAASPSTLTQNPNTTGSVDQTQMNSTSKISQTAPQTPQPPKIKPASEITSAQDARQAANKFRLEGEQLQSKSKGNSTDHLQPLSQASDYYYRAAQIEKLNSPNGTRMLNEALDYSIKSDGAVAQRAFTELSKTESGRQQMNQILIDMFEQKTYYRSHTNPDTQRLQQDNMKKVLQKIKDTNYDQLNFQQQNALKTMLRHLGNY